MRYKCRCTAFHVRTTRKKNTRLIKLHTHAVGSHVHNDPGNIVLNAPLCLLNPPLINLVRPSLPVPRATLHHLNRCFKILPSATLLARPPNIPTPDKPAHVAQRTLLPCPADALQYLTAGPLAWPPDQAVGTLQPPPNNRPRRNREV